MSRSWKEMNTATGFESAAAWYSMGKAKNELELD
jgi:hypothetical protein